MRWISDGHHCEGRCLLRELPDRKSTRLNSSHQITSYAAFCLKKKTKLRPMPKYALRELAQRAGAFSEADPIPVATRHVPRDLALPAANLFRLPSVATPTRALP